MKENQYIKERYKRKKQRSRVWLGFKQFRYKPFLNLLWIIVFMVSILIAWGRQTALDYLENNIDIPDMLYSFLGYIVTFMAVLLPVLIVLSVFEWIGEHTARRTESCLVVAFDAKHLRHGHPILLDKYKIKGTGVTVCEFYSPIPYKIWIEKQDAIADSMNAHFVEEIQYGGKNNVNGQRIIIKTAKGRKNTKQGVLYDEEL